MESKLKPIPGQLHCWKDGNWGSRMEWGTGTCLQCYQQKWVYMYLSSRKWWSNCWASAEVCPCFIKIRCDGIFGKKKIPSTWIGKSSIVCRKCYNLLRSPIITHLLSSNMCNSFLLKIYICIFKLPCYTNLTELWNYDSQQDHQNSLQLPCQDQYSLSPAIDQKPFTYMAVWSSVNLITLILPSSLPNYRDFSALL